MAAATQPSAEESAATTTDSDTPRSRACSAATFTNASVRRAPARASSRGSRSGGGGGVFTGDSASVTRFRVQRYRGDVLVLVRALPLEPHHSDHRGRRQPRLGGDEPHLDAEYSLHGRNCFCKRKARRAEPRFLERSCDTACPGMDGPAGESARAAN